MGPAISVKAGVEDNKHTEISNQDIEQVTNTTTNTDIKNIIKTVSKMTNDTHNVVENAQNLKSNLQTLVKTLADNTVVLNVSGGAKIENLIIEQANKAVIDVTDAYVNQMQDIMKNVMEATSNTSNSADMDITNASAVALGATQDAIQAAEQKAVTSQELSQESFLAAVDAGVVMSDTYIESNQRIKNTINVINNTNIVTDVSNTYETINKILNEVNNQLTTDENALTELETKLNNRVEINASDNVVLSGITIKQLNDVKATVGISRTITRILESGMSASNMAIAANAFGLTQSTEVKNEQTIGQAASNDAKQTSDVSQALSQDRGTIWKLLIIVVGLIIILPIICGVLPSKKKDGDKKSSTKHQTSQYTEVTPQIVPQPYVQSVQSYVQPVQQPYAPPVQPVQQPYTPPVQPVQSYAQNIYA
jgi:hypothetical protein